MQWDCNAASEYNIHVIIATLLHTKYVLTYMLSTLLVCRAGSRGGRLGDRPPASKAARVWRLVRLSRGALTHRGQAPWHVLPSAMQREQPISLVRSLCALIEHRVAGSRVVVVGDRGRPTASKAARVIGVVRLSRGAVSHRGQVPWHVLPSTM